MILRTKDILAETRLEFKVKESKGGNRWVEVYSDFHCVSIDWYYEYSNNLENSRLVIELWEGGRPRAGRYYSRAYGPHKILERELNFDRTQPDKYCWSDKSQSLYNKQIVEYCIKLLIDYLHKKELSII